MIFIPMLITFVFSAQVLGYPPQERLMPDGAKVPEGAIVHEDSVASASENVGDEYESDDSDMFMEPDGAESMIQQDQHEDNPSKEETEQSAVTVVRVQKSEDVSSSASSSEPGSAEKGKTLETDSQNFFPSFAELFGNHRLPFTENQQRFRPNRFVNYFSRNNDNSNSNTGRGYQAAASSNNKDSHHALLGSGNFGVIRGGTYYPEDKEHDEYNVDESLYSPFYHGRGRSNYYRNPKPQPVRGGDFFANFRDFADITAPPKSSFSHLSVVYANKNSTNSHNKDNGSNNNTRRVTEPRNIIETLRMLEEQDNDTNDEDDELTTTTELPMKKLSLNKLKLIKFKREQEEKSRRLRMNVEPLLALS